MKRRIAALAAAVIAVVSVGVVAPSTAAQAATPALDAPPPWCVMPVLTPACVAKGAADGAGAVGEAYDFATDPFGSVAQMLQDAATGLTETLLPELHKVMQPDLDADWFQTSYSLTFALAMLVFAALLIWNFIQLSRRQISGDQAVQSIAFYAPLFLFSALFGPAIGAFLVKGLGFLSRDVISKLFGSSIEETTEQLIQLQFEAGSGKQVAGEMVEVAGGTFVSILLLFCMVVALILVLLILLVQLVTLYLTGVIFPLSVVWLVHPTQRSKGLKLLMVWVGILFSQVLMFLLLGVAFKMVGGQLTGWDKGNTPLQILLSSVVAIVALFMATLSPLLLLKLGKSVLPTTTPDHMGGGGGGGSSSPTNSKLSQMSASQGGEAAPAQSGGATGGGSARSGGGGSPMSALSSGGGEAGSSGAGAGGGGGPARVPVGAGSGGGAGAASGVGGGTGSAAGFAGSSGASAGAGGGAAAGGSLGAGAAAAGSTGVGLPVAAVLGTAAAGAKTASITADLSRRGAEMAATEEDREPEGK